MKVLMVGCDKSTKGGMWKVVENYLSSEWFVENTNLKYIPTSITGTFFRKILFTLRAYVKILILFLFDRPDILHVHMSERGSVYRKGIVISIAKIFKTKVIIHMHGAEFEVWYKTLSKNKKEKVRHIINRADRIILLGEYWKSFISSIYPSSQIYILHNAIDVPKKNYYNPEAKSLLFLGVVGQRKGAYDLLLAFQSCIKKIPEDINLIYYGPDYEKKIEKEIENSKMNKRVKYLGYLTDDEKPKIFNNTMISILPSYNEGLPMTILETMAYGIPNISTNIAAIPEVVSNKNGVIIEPGNVEQLAEEILALINNPQQRIEKSNLAFETIQNGFSLKNHMAKLMNLYKDVLEIR